MGSFERQQGVPTDIRTGVLPDGAASLTNYGSHRTYMRAIERGEGNLTL
jgi:hypothetical protein